VRDHRAPPRFEIFHLGQRVPAVHQPPLHGPLSTEPEHPESHALAPTPALRRGGNAGIGSDRWAGKSGPNTGTALGSAPAPSQPAAIPNMGFPPLPGHSCARYRGLRPQGPNLERCRPPRPVRSLGGPSTSKGRRLPARAPVSRRGWASLRPPLFETPPICAFPLLPFEGKSHASAPSDARPN